eukprot:3465291-Rhodomonas_salina.1
MSISRVKYSLHCRNSEPRWGPVRSRPSSRLVVVVLVVCHNLSDARAGYAPTSTTAAATSTEVQGTNIPIQRQKPQTGTRPRRGILTRRTRRERDNDGSIRRPLFTKRDTNDCECKGILREERHHGFAIEEPFYRISESQQLAAGASAFVCREEGNLACLPFPFNPKGFVPERRKRA